MSAIPLRFWGAANRSRDPVGAARCRLMASYLLGLPDGRARTRSLVQALGAGRPLDDALRVSFGMDAATLQQRWTAWAQATASRP